MSIRTLEDVEEESEDREESETGSAEDLPRLDVPEETLEEFAEEARQFLLPAPPDIDVDRGDRRDIDFPGRLPRRGSIVNRIESNIGLEIGDLDDELDQVTNIDVSELDDTELLRAIAQSSILSAQYLGVVSETLVQSLNATFSILGSVEPFRRVVVSGTNDIDTTSEAVPVVPNSDTQSIPTRILFVKASDNNKQPIAFGDDETRPDSGFILESGENIMLAIDLRDTTLWMASDSASAEVELLGLV